MERKGCSKHSWTWMKVGWWPCAVGAKFWKARCLLIGRWRHLTDSSLILLSSLFWVFLPLGNNSAFPFFAVPLCQRLERKIEFEKMGFFSRQKKQSTAGKRKSQILTPTRPRVLSWKGLSHCLIETVKISIDKIKITQIQGSQRFLITKRWYDTHNSYLWELLRTINSG